MQSELNRLYWIFCFQCGIITEYGDGVDMIIPLKSICNGCGNRCNNWPAYLDGKFPVYNVTTGREHYVEFRKNKYV